MRRIPLRRRRAALRLRRGKNRRPDTAGPVADIGAGKAERAEDTAPAEGIDPADATALIADTAVRPAEDKERPGEDIAVCIRHDWDTAPADGRRICLRRR